MTENMECKAVEEDRDTCKASGWKHPHALSARKMFEDKRATEVVLPFLGDTKVGCMVTLASPEEEGPVPPPDGEGEEGGPSPP